jgi:acyl-CoA thioester hydrolase
MVITETTYRVLYAHTDRMGIVNNERYLEYFEAGRGDMMRKIGYPYKMLESKNIALPLIEAHCNFRNPAKYDDVILIRSYLKNIPTVKIRIDYELYLDDILIADGYTIHSFIDLNKLKPVRPPDDFIYLLKSKF